MADTNKSGADTNKPVVVDTKKIIEELINYN